MKSNAGVIGWCLALWVALVLLFGVLVYGDYQQYLKTTLVLPSAGMELELQKGDSAYAVIRRLRRDKVLDDSLRGRLYLKFYIRWGVSGMVHTGIYHLKPGMTVAKLFAMLVSGKVKQYSLAVIEGWTFAELREAVEKNEHLHHELTGLEDAEIMNLLGYQGEHPEGRFFPDTYFFPAGTSDLDFLRRAYQTMVQHLHAAWAGREDDFPLKSPYQVLILASIVEKETALTSDMPLVAGVFVNRLKKGMKLQTDPTIIYGLGEHYHGDLTYKNMRIDTPYNTYIHKGLPPTPICLPGRAALNAAVNPDVKDGYLYFVATGKGGHSAFSKTLDAHNQAVKRYLQQLKENRAEDDG